MKTVFILVSPLSNRYIGVRAVCQSLQWIISGVNPVISKVSTTALVKKVNLSQSSSSPYILALVKYCYYLQNNK